MVARECPECGEEKICSTAEAEAAFNGLNNWGDLGGATHVCSWCRAARFPDGWRRAKSVRARASELANASSNHEKDASHYRRKLRGGS